MSNVKVIEAKKTNGRRNSTFIPDQKRVAAYCRVSTDSEEQQSSYQSQVLHYSQQILLHVADLKILVNGINLY